MLLPVTTDFGEIFLAVQNDLNSLTSRVRLRQRTFDSKVAAFWLIGIHGITSEKFLEMRHLLLHLNRTFVIGALKKARDYSV